MNNKIYDIIKYTSQIALPALAGLVASVGGVWGMPNLNETVQTITACATFLGALVGVSSVMYHSQEKLGKDELHYEQDI